MAVSYGFYDSLNGDRKYTAEQMSYIFNSLINDGVFMNIGNHLAVEEGTGMQVNVGSGFAWFNSTWTRNDADYPLSIEISDLLQDRIDAVVLEVNETLTVRANSLKVITGTPASEPQKPTLTNTSEIHQYPLAYVTVGVGVTSITQANIENCIGTDPCPFVTGVLDTIDATALIARWEAQFNEWFESLEDTLSGDVAGNLLSKINDNKDHIPRLYKATFLLDGWIGSSAPYTQIVSVTPVNNALAITADSIMTTSIFISDEYTGDTEEALLEAAAIINKGTKTFGAGTIICSVEEKPESDVEVFFNAENPY